MAQAGIGGGGGIIRPPVDDPAVEMVNGLRFSSAFSGKDSAITCSPVERCAAVFQVTGTPNAAIVVTVISVQNTPLTNGQETVYAHGWTIVAPAALDGDGNATIMVGGTVVTSSGNSSGQYLGSTTLSVIYNPLLDMGP